MFAGSCERLRCEASPQIRLLGDALSIAMHFLPVAKGNAVKAANQTPLAAHCCVKLVMPFGILGLCNTFEILCL